MSLDVPGCPCMSLDVPGFVRRASDCSPLLVLELLRSPFQSSFPAGALELLAFCMHRLRLPMRTFATFALFAII
eukprot:9000613-Pyramimonas_sp.AAC.1